MAKKAFQKTGEQVSDLLCTLRNQCVRYLNGKVKEGETIDITEMEDYGSLCVTYDGGNHPEYAANPYSTVEGVFKKDGKVYLETEDCDELELDRVETMDLYGVCDFIETGTI